MHTTSRGEHTSHDVDDPTTDGRTARRDRNKNAVLDAVVDLFHEDNLSPGVNEVADRSGVSLRSVYRYFDDVESLIAAAIHRQYARSKQFFDITDDGRRPLRARINDFCSTRVEFFEQIRAVHLAAAVRSRLDPAVDDTVDRARQDLSKQTEAMFAPELATMASEQAEVVRLTVDVLTQFETLEFLRGPRGLSRAHTERYLTETLAGILQ